MEVEIAWNDVDRRNLHVIYSTVVTMKRGSICYEVFIFRGRLKM